MKVGDSVMVIVDDDVYPFDYPPKNTICQITGIIVDTEFGSILDEPILGYELEYDGKRYQLYEWDVVPIHRSNINVD